MHTYYYTTTVQKLEFSGQRYHSIGLPSIHVEATDESALGLPRGIFTIKPTVLGPIVAINRRLYSPYKFMQTQANSILKTCNQYHTGNRDANSSQTAAAPFFLC